MHRYGRHGPRAWFKWRRRHYTPRPPSRLPVPVVRPPTRIIQVEIPINAERVLIIVGTPPEFSEEDEKAVETYLKEVPRITEEVTPIPRPRDEIEQIFAAMALEDAENYRRKVLTYGWIQEHMKTVLRGSFAQVYLLDEEGRKPLIQKATKAYLDKLEVMGIRHCPSPLHDKILRKALEDKKVAPPRTQDGRMAFHQRDLGVVSVLAICNISVEEAPNRLAAIHDLVDAYDEFYKYPEEEVIWLQNSF